MPRHYDEEEERDPWSFSWMEPTEPTPPSEILPSPEQPDYGMPAPSPPFMEESPEPFDETAWMNQPTKSDFGVPVGGGGEDPGGFSWMNPPDDRWSAMGSTGDWMRNERDLSRGSGPGITTTTPSVPQPVPGRTPRDDERDRRAGLPPRYNIDWDAPREMVDPAQPTPPATTPPPATPPVAPPAPAPGAPMPGTNANGLGAGANAYEGFNDQRAQNPAVSFKDAYLEALKQAPLAPGQDKTQLAAWFNQYIKPKVEAHGHKVNSVDGDKVNFTSPEGTFTMDYYHWDANPAGKRYATWMGGSGASGAGAGAAGGTGGGASAAGLAGKAKTWDEAFAMARSTLSPSLSKDQMEAGLAAIFGHLPGYGGVYKESVMRGGNWHDLINAYDPGKGGSWVDAWPGPKDGGSAGGGGGMGTSSVPSGSSGVPGAGVPGAAGVQTSSLVPSYEEFLRLIGRG